MWAMCLDRKTPFFHQYKTNVCMSLGTFLNHSYSDLEFTGELRKKVDSRRGDALYSSEKTIKKEPNRPCRSILGIGQEVQKVDDFCRDGYKIYLLSLSSSLLIGYGVRT